MSEITITYTGSLLRYQNLSIKNARTQEVLSKNLGKHDTFQLPCGNHVIEIAFRFNLFRYPSSRFSLDVPEGKHLYFDLKEKEIGRYTFTNISLSLKVLSWIIWLSLTKNDYPSIYWGTLLSTPVIAYYQIQQLILIQKSSRLRNGYLELYHSWEY
ncbi:hypothetical protein [Aquirufa aurantiipilula]